MKLFNQKRSTARLEAAIPKGLRHSTAWRRFRKNRAALWSLRILYVLVFTGVFADFIANDKPIVCSIEGKIYFPIIKDYGLKLGWTKGDEAFFQRNWQTENYDFAILPPIPYNAQELNTTSRYISPLGKQEVKSWRFRHWLGTDHLGRDLAAIMVSGTRAAMLVSVISMGIATIIGLLLGSLAGFFGDDRLRSTAPRFWLNLIGLACGLFYAFVVRRYALTEGVLFWELLKSFSILMLALLTANLLARFLERRLASAATIAIPADALVNRLIEILHAIPTLLLLLSIAALIRQPSMLYMMAVIGLVRWTGIARFIRAELLRIRSLEYIEAARAIGLSEWRILFRHALPNGLAPVLVAIAFGMANTVLLEAFLSFLGIGLSPEAATWGSALRGVHGSYEAWWAAVFPGMAIFVTITIFNLIGEGLSEALGA